MLEQSNEKDDILSVFDLCNSLLSSLLLSPGVKSRVLVQVLVLVRCDWLAITEICTTARPIRLRVACIIMKPEM